MKYLQNKDRKNNKISFLILFASIFFLALFWKDAIVSVSSKFAFWVSVPFWKAENYVSDSLSSVFISFNDKDELKRQNESLLAGLKNVKIYKLENELLREENLILKSFLGKDFEQEETFSSGKNIITKNKKIKPIISYVLEGSATPPFDSLIVDMGIKSGVSVGDIAIDEKDFVLGKLIEVGDNYSKIKLLSSYGQKVSSFLGDSKTMVELIGLGSGNFFVSLPKDFLIKNGDVAWYPGENILMIALVDEIEYKEGETFKKVFLKSPYNNNEVRILGILKNIK